MAYLLGKWRILHASKRLSLSELTEHSSYDITSNSIYMITAADDFVYIHVGRTIRDTINLDLVGRSLRTISDEIADDLSQAYSAIVASGSPAYLRFTSVSDKALMWSRLVLPIPAGPDAFILLCYSEVLSHHSEVYEYIFKILQFPCLWPIRY